MEDIFLEKKDGKMVKLSVLSKIKNISDFRFRIYRLDLGKNQDFNI
jgi:hypothetical protein